MNTIKYNGTEIENNEKVVEAVIDNLIVNIIKQDSNTYIANLAENNYDSIIEYDSYILDEYEIEMMHDRESCYEFLVEFFNQYCCSYGVM